MKFLMGVIFTAALIFVPPHGANIRNQIEFDICYYYGICYVIVFYDCGPSGDTCKSKMTWTILNEKDAPRSGE